MNLALVTSYDATLVPSASGPPGPPQVRLGRFAARGTDKPGRRPDHRGHRGRARPPPAGHTRGIGDTSNGGAPGAASPSGPRPGRRLRPADVIVRPCVTIIGDEPPVRSNTGSVVPHGVRMRPPPRCPGGQRRCFRPSPGSPLDLTGDDLTSASSSVMPRQNRHPQRRRPVPLLSQSSRTTKPAQ
jgi:hypothetical protein